MNSFHIFQNNQPLSFLWMHSSKLHPTNCLTHVNNKEDCKHGDCEENVQLLPCCVVVCGKAVYRIYKLQIKGTWCALLLSRQLRVEKTKWCLWTLLFKVLRQLVVENLQGRIYSICESKISKHTGFQRSNSYVPPSKFYTHLDLK